MASKRHERIKNLYNSVITMDFIKSAKNDEDVESLEEALMGGEVVKSPKKIEEPGTEGLMEKPEVVKKQPKETEEFVSPEEIAKQLGFEEKVEKKEPALPHRIKEPDLFGEIETTKLTPGAFKAKICPVCGSFNYPVWKKECAKCKGEYRRMLHDVDYEGYSPRKAISVASARSKGIKGRQYLGEEALREIWEKEGHIELPETSVNIEEELTDRRGLTGVPNRLKLQGILENKLNVVRVPTKVLDKDTGKEYTTTDVYYDPEGNPVPIKYGDRDYFSLFEISKRLQMSPSGVLKEISDYNAEHGKDPTKDKDAIKPAVYIDDLNQAYSWKTLKPIFEERIKEIYKSNIQNFMSNASKRWEYLKERAEQLALTRNKRKQEKEKILKKMATHPQKKEMAELLKLRSKDSEIKTKIGKVKEKIEEMQAEGKTPDEKLIMALKQLKEELKESLPERKTLEGRVGIELTNLMNRMRDVRKNYNRVIKAEKRVRESLGRLKSQINDYITAFKDNVPSTLQDLAMSQTGHPYGETKGDFNINQLAEELKNQKTSSLRIYELNNLLKIADDPEQLTFFPTFEKAQKKRDIEKELYKEPTEEEIERKKIKVKNIMTKTKLTKDEAEERLYKQNHPLADPEDLNPKQLVERKKLINQLMQEHPNEEEAMARVEEMEAKPFEISKARPPMPEEKETEGFSDRVCPHCGEKGFLKDSPICQKCGFREPKNMKQVVIETVSFPLLKDESGNPIPKKDESGEVMIDSKGNIMYRRRQQKSHVLVQLQLDEADRPVWASARTISPLARDIGAKTKTEREQYFETSSAKTPKVKDPKPITKKPSDFRPLYTLEQNEEGELVKKPTGEVVHKQKCKGCPDPWVKVPATNMEEYPPIETAIKFLKGEELPRNTKAWKLEDVFTSEEPERAQKMQTPTILPTSSSRFEKIVKIID